MKEVKVRVSERDQLEEEEQQEEEVAVLSFSQPRFRPLYFTSTGEKSRTKL